MPNKTNLLDASILIVDDRGHNVMLLELLLQSVGYHHITATQDPFAVCDLHRQHHFDLILLDLQMPGMDGFAVLEGLSQVEADGYVPVLAITVEPEYKLRALAAGAKDFIAKPFELAELTTRIHNLLEVRLLYKKLAVSVASLESFALHDALTGLANRRLLLDRLNQSRLSSARTLGQGALLFLDLDKFKLLNDTLGHEAGDLLLQQLSVRLLQCVRELDCVARFGGDEFLVLLDALGQQASDAAQQAETVAQKIVQAMAQPFDLLGQPYGVSLSIGAVVFQGTLEPVGDLLKKADLAMYRAKSLGRNQVCFFDPDMQATVQAQALLLQDLRRGIDAKEFELFYQIQVDAQGQALGAKALLRWHHASRGLLLPGEFMTLANASGLLLPLGEWVLAAACQQLVQWRHSPTTSGWRLAVSISASQFAQSDFAAKLARVLQSTGAPAQRLTLELTERTLNLDVEGTLAKMNAVCALGVGFCLDDFGAGLASLDYLKQMPLVQIKVDQALVHSALTDDSVAVVADSIVALGTCLGLPVVAKGVETTAQQAFFAALGCAAFQGNHLGAVAQPEQMLASYMKNRPPALMNKA